MREAGLLTATMSGPSRAGTGPAPPATPDIPNALTRLLRPPGPRVGGPAPAEGRP
ncbi:hypothetical protein V1634_32925 [Plantactinospora veratri]|uniref:Uncharacterized protein n=1 Tax=Plantactinospora veratri TaxID=1436122 RepID=A0ABU7SNZ8_9ACTN